MLVCAGKIHLCCTFCVWLCVCYVLCALYQRFILCVLCVFLYGVLGFAFCFQSTSEQRQRGASKMRIKGKRRKVSFSVSVWVWEEINRKIYGTKASKFLMKFCQFKLLAFGIDNNKPLENTKVSWRKSPPGNWNRARGFPILSWSFCIKKNRFHRLENSMHVLSIDEKKNRSWNLRHKFVFHMFLSILT